MPSIDLVEYWKNASMVEDYDVTAPLVEPIFDLSRRGDHPLHLHLRGTNFQIKVWEALMRIPPGGVATYGQIANEVGHPNATRAVGNAVGAQSDRCVDPVSPGHPQTGRIWKLPVWHGAQESAAGT